MLDVFFTIDVEIWCDGWDSIDQKFAGAFKKYIYGHTPKGDYGLPYQLKVFKDNNVNAVFFVEPLFSGRFGKDPLTEIVGLINEYGQEIQLHAHTEWVDEAVEPIIPGLSEKKQHIRYFSVQQQERIIAVANEWLTSAGANNLSAFRAGSFGFNLDTLIALRKNGFTFDSSYNATHMGLDSGVLTGTIVTEPMRCEDIIEYPMTVYYDRPNHLRHTQLAACSFREMERLLWQALEQKRKSFVILSHNFELMNSSFSNADKVVVNRFNKLCHFLQKNQDCFRTTGFDNLDSNIVAKQPTPLRSSVLNTGLRTIEQLWSRTT